MSQNRRVPLGADAHIYGMFKNGVQVKQSRAVELEKMTMPVGAVAPVCPLLLMHTV